MKHLLTTLGLVLLCTGAFAQTSWELPVNLSQKCWLRGHAYGPKIEWEGKKPEYGFLAFSAYSQDTSRLIELQWRYRLAEGWSEWQDLTVPHEGRSPGRQAFAAEPIREPISGWQVRSSDSLRQDLIARFFLAPAEKKKPLNQPQTAPQSGETCQCPPPPICDRACWCPGGNCPPPGYSPTQPTHLIVHHSAGFTNYHDYQWVVAYYWDLHVNTNGWSDIGYNWLIDPNGVVYRGRGSGVVGAHFSCLNGQTTGICLIGNYMNQQPAPAMLRSLVELAAWESCRQGIAPADTSLHSPSTLVLRHLSGHRDANPAPVGCPRGTVCPGDQVYPKLDSLAQVINGQTCLLSNLRYSTTEPYLSPNPAREFLDLHWAGAQMRSVKILDARGRVLRRANTGGSRHRLSLQGLPAGHYLLVSESEHELSRQRFIIP